MKRLIVLRVCGSARVSEIIPRAAADESGAEFLIINETGLAAMPDLSADASKPARIRVITPHHAYGAGGAQKVGYRYAIQRKIDAVGFMEFNRRNLAIAPFGPLFAALESQSADFCHGVASGSVVSPWRAVSNALHRLASGGGWREWNARYRVFRPSALARVAFELNTNRGHFSTELLLELLDQSAVGIEVPIEREGRRLYGLPTPAGLLHAVSAALKYRLQRYHLFFDVRFHPEITGEGSPRAAGPYHDKPGSFSPHAFITESEKAIPRNSAVLDIGCSTGYTARRLAADRGCRVAGVDNLPPALVDGKLFDYHEIDLERYPARVAALLERTSFDVVLLLDVLEHLASPESFLLTLRKARFARPPRFFMSTGNVAFIVIRIMLLFGFFNYGRKGILDVTHKRLFSYRTFKNLLEQTGFLVVNRRFFPLPFRALGFSPGIARFLEAINRGLIRVAPSLFGYQMMYEALPLASAEEMLHDATAAESGPAREPAQS